ncbi:MAG: hypothetical protein ACTSWI_02400 [Alphaproteobacteria bacterium]
MDEPFGALDALTRSLMQDFLLELWEQDRKTMLLVTHDIDEAIYLADRTVIMTAHPGRVREVTDVDLPRPRPRDALGCEIHQDPRPCPGHRARRGRQGRVRGNRGLIGASDLGPKRGLRRSEMRVV